MGESWPLASAYLDIAYYQISEIGQKEKNLKAKEDEQGKENKEKLGSLAL